ncbi:hypothetical protein K437DRAFT_255518 [Tilletiaria anomala UBC 951]|uniref:Uncharacterized protein n=1 Tax=Tilletiaria anomala (strain ATCC 24038 / CBS 436.72 / UBC 951) TaxID=1037660 RepID=A0A066WCN1_TILAU|nr:uncharacterized protein K437DRAFT_255518 [Tilletiaria anomala UBC 951]KDN48540.1 hypothetical protein K437DRAFT_255518 [Tilletiaria anomala UBC 951]
MIMRTLCLDFSKAESSIANMMRSNTNATTQTYLIGPRLLVSPVTLHNVMDWKA